MLLLECAPRAFRGGNSRHTRNLRCMHGGPADVLTDSYPQEEFWHDIFKVTGGYTDEQLARLVIRESAGCRRWIVEQGIRFQPTLRGIMHESRTNAFFPGGGEGCIEPGDQPSMARRRFHHATFYGFLLCFASTTTTAIYDYVVGWPAPYPTVSLPVVLGILGGIGLLVGPAGQLWLRSRRNPEMSDPAQDGMDAGFILLLLLTRVTGLRLLALRETAAMDTILAVHLGAVLARFLTMPYGQFAHAVYGGAALLRFAIEETRPPQQLGGG